MMGYGTGWGWMGGFGVLAMLLVCVALVVVVVWLVRALVPWERRSARETALDTAASARRRGGDHPDSS